MKEAVICCALVILLALQVGLIANAFFRLLNRYRHRKTYELIVAALVLRVMKVRVNNEDISIIDCNWF
jgi:hypothetical protein